MGAPPPVPPPAPPKKSRKKLYAVIGGVVVVVIVALFVWYSFGPVQGNLLFNYSYTGSSQAAWSLSSSCARGIVPVSYPNRNTGASHTCDLTFTNHDPNAAHTIERVLFGGAAYVSTITPNLNLTTSGGLNGVGSSYGTTLTVASGASQTVSITFGLPLPPNQYDATLEFFVD
jgi:hypothetical protein